MSYLDPKRISFNLSVIGKKQKPTTEKTPPKGEETKVSDDLVQPKK